MLDLDLEQISGLLSGMQWCCVTGLIFTFAGMRAISLCLTTHNHYVWKVCFSSLRRAPLVLKRLARFTLEPIQISAFPLLRKALLIYFSFFIFDCIAMEPTMTKYKRERVKDSLFSLRCVRLPDPNKCSIAMRDI